MRKIIFIITMALLLSSCVGESNFKPIKIDYPNTEMERLQEVITVDGYSMLLAELKKAEYSIEVDHKIDHQVLKGTETYIKLSDDTALHVYEYDNAKSLYEGIISISDDGYGIAEIRNGKIIGGTDNEWVEQPNFYLFNNLIIFYVGRNSDIITFLNEISACLLCEII